MQWQPGQRQVKLGVGVVMGDIKEKPTTKNVYKCSPVLLFISSSNDKPARKRLELGRTGAKRRRSELHLHQARQSDTWEEKTINTGTRNKGKPAAGGRYAKS